MYRPPIVLALITLAACVTTRATPYSAQPVKASAEDVEVFTDTPPSRDYEEVGLIEVEQPGLASNYGDLVLRARREAAKMGADAIIVTRNPKKSKELMETGSREKNGGRSLTVIEKEVPRIMVKAIVWKGPPTNHDSTGAAPAAGGVQTPSPDCPTPRLCLHAPSTVARRETPPSVKQDGAGS